jgi:hypothetical protein
MSTSELKPGDRIRLTRKTHGGRFQRGAKGTVLGGPYPEPGARPYYEVAMDGNESDDTVVSFAADEIEPDV